LPARRGVIHTAANKPASAGKHPKYCVKVELFYNYFLFLQRICQYLSGKLHEVLVYNRYYSEALFDRYCAMQGNFSGMQLRDV